MRNMTLGTIWILLIAGMTACPLGSQAGQTKETGMKDQGKIAEKPLFRDPVYDGAAETSYHMAYLFFVPVESWPGKPVFYYLTTVNESFEITGIPLGSYYLYAIEARNPDSIDAVGLPIDWPQPVTIYADKKVGHTEIEMSTFLSKRVRFWNAQGFLRGVGHLNAENVLTEELGPYGRVIDAKGNSIPKPRDSNASAFILVPVLL